MSYTGTVKKMIGHLYYPQKYNFLNKYVLQICIIITLYYRPTSNCFLMITPYNVCTNFELLLLFIRYSPLF